jgi:hypothetical protein
MRVIYADARLSNLGRPELEELTANVLIDTGALDMVTPQGGFLRASPSMSRCNCSSPT